MKALILAGGFGTRLRPLSCARPKSLFPIVNKPLLQWTFERLAKNGITEVILAVNYQTEIAIKQQKILKNSFKVSFSRDPPGKPLGTGGPIKRAEKKLGSDAPFLVLNGDIFADINYSLIVDLHRKKNGVATLSLCRVEDPSMYGVAELAKDNRILKFVEKPSRKEAPSNLVNAGAYVLSPEIFRYIPRGRAVSIEREVFPKLAEEGKLFGRVFDGLWMDIGKPEDYLKLNRKLLEVMSNQNEVAFNDVKIKKPVAFAKDVSVKGGSVIGPYAVIGKNVTIGSGVRIKNSVVFERATISDSALIEGAVIGEGVYVGKNAKINKHTVIGDYVRIGNNVTLAKGVSVCPAKTISESVLTSK
ncbi:MAG: NDP-sugar synthase, partial [Candidatus Bathyarchaeia archaeon]